MFTQLHQLLAYLALVLIGSGATATGADRTLVHEIIIDAPVADVWHLYTTAEGGRKWMAPKVEVDLRVGGTFRASYHPDSNLNDEHTIINRILAYEPMRLLALRNEQAPAGFGWVDKFQQTWSVAYFEPIGQTQTKVRIVGMGFGEGPEWDELYDFFKQGNQIVLNLLKQQFPSQAVNDSDEVLKVLHRLVGGEWIHEAEFPNGGVFRVRSITAFAADGKALTSRGWLGNAAGMFDHGRTIIYRTPESMGGGVRFFNVDENGSTAQGAIRLTGQNRLEWDWQLTDLKGNTRPFRVTMEFEDDDHYKFTLDRRDDHGAWQQQVSAKFTRVDSAPERFRKMQRGE